VRGQHGVGRKVFGSGVRCVYGIDLGEDGRKGVLLIDEKLKVRFFLVMRKEGRGTDVFDLRGNVYLEPDTKESWDALERMVGPGENRNMVICM
jgi:hypothetical protein